MNGIVDFLRNFASFRQRNSSEQKKREERVVDAQGVVKSPDQVILDWWASVKNAYYSYHRRVYEARLYFYGLQWISYSNSDGRFILKPNPDRIPRPDINSFARAGRAVAAQFSNAPTVDVRYFGAGQDGILAEQVCLKLLEAARSQMEVDRLARRAGNLFFLDSMLFLFPQIDRSNQVVINRPDSRAVSRLHCPTCDYIDDIDDVEAEQVDQPQICPRCGSGADRYETTRLENITEHIVKPRLKLNIHSPLSVFPPMGCSDLESCPWIFVSSRADRYTVKKKWGIDAKPEQRFTSLDNYYLNLLETEYIGRTQAYHSDRDQVLVVECYVPPGRTDVFPDGQYAVVINDKVGEKSPWPFGTQSYPMVRIPWLDVDGWWPKSTSFDMVGIQRAKNMRESLIQLNDMVNAVEPLLINEDTIVSKVTGVADKVIKWRPAGAHPSAPTRLQHGKLNEQVYGKVGQLDAELERVANLTQAMLGQRPRNVQAAAAIRQLTAQSEQVWIGTMGNWTDGWAECYKKTLIILQKSASDEMLYELLDSVDPLAVRVFRELNLEAKLQVEVLPGQTVPRNRIEKQQTTLALLDRRLLDPTDPQTKEEIHRQFGTWYADKKFSGEARRIRMENAIMARGSMVTVDEEIDDHQLHQSLHLEYMRSVDYLRLPVEAQEMMRVHLASHKQILEQRQAEQLQMQQAAQAAGMPGGGGPGKPPAEVPQPRIRSPRPGEMI